MKWNKTSEVLPEFSMFVLGYSDIVSCETEYHVFEYYCDDDYTHGWYNYNCNEIDPPSHWMELPKKPE